MSFSRSDLPFGIQIVSGLPTEALPYSMASLGQAQMQAMQWMHRPNQRGFPPQGRCRSQGRACALAAADAAVQGAELCLL